eukprot:TRINITY_DN57_c0_g1_i1.p1 TRINITY_DN57_c0_g1~~TRINITY_DN57_c0_g1_i1.p1  ORF type:complete len:241 (-),score=63.54 TRINITY_DN57_c0_g1_i1:235-957(-)
MVNVKEATIPDYLRFVGSLCLLIFSGVVTCYAIWAQKTSMWKAVPGWVSLIIFIMVLFLLGIMEGLQIALVELKRQEPESYKNSHPKAYRLGQYAMQGDNVERFLMGRQVFVVCCVFFAAKLTTIHGNSESGFLFYVPDWVQALFLETGLLACVVVVIIAQLMPQIVASLYPTQFLELLVMRPAYWACIILETSGVTHICWVLAWGMGKMFRMKEEVTADGVQMDKFGNKDNQGYVSDVA